MALDDLKKRLYKLKGERDILQRDYEGTVARIKDLSELLDDIEEARKIVQEVAKMTQEQLEVNISSIVCLALSTVFVDPYKFGMKFVLRRNKTECDLYFERNGNILEDLEEASGVGAIDIAAFGLRCALLNMEDPPKRKFLALDEPFKHLRGEGNHQRASEMITRISRDLGIQMVIVADVGFSVKSDRTFTFTKVGDNVKIDVN